jgi:DNA-binding SARP family transcriptional activator/tetratricopeptide (TPR) repeat protein
MRRRPGGSSLLGDRGLSDIQHAYPLILNKVASPQYANPVLWRQRLIDWLNAASACRAAVIAADAGYGKTTLLYQWEREVEFPCYWYKLDRNDRDWTFHISYLIEAIGKRHPGFGRRAQSMLEQMGGPGSSRPAVAAYLIAEMHERLTEPCTFIIDDWQYVNASTEVRGFWNQMLRDAPATCRFVFASRVKPKLQFARFKTHSGYAELRTDDLRFTEVEIEALFRDIYNDPLEPGHVEELERRTEGWAASLQLVEVSLRERTTVAERGAFIRSITATRDSDLFTFLAEEVLDQQPEATRNFLLTTSILHQITPEVAERLAGVHDGRRELGDLEDRGLFTTRLDNNRYRYHHLFRDFLERRLLAERSEAEVSGLHIHAASYFETTEQWPDAIEHYLCARLQRQAARLIAKYGEDIVASGRLASVDGWLGDLPADAIKQNSRLSLLHGEALGMRGSWTSALEALNRSRSYFARKGDPRLEALACLKLSTVYSNSGEATKAAAAAEDGVNLVPNEAEVIRLRLEGNVAVTRVWLEGDLERATEECRRIGDRAAELGFDHFAAIGFHNAGELLLRRGKTTQAIDLLGRASAFWASMSSPFGDDEDYVNALLYGDHLSRALDVSVSAMRRTSEWPRSLASARNGFAAALIAMDRLNEAIQALEGVAVRPSSLGSARGTVFARLIEALFLAGADGARIRPLAEHLSEEPVDPRYIGDVAAARAILDHIGPDCRGQCQQHLKELAFSERVGAHLTATVGRLKIRSLSLNHGSRRAHKDAWSTLVSAMEHGYLTPHKLWARRFALHPAVALEVPGGRSALENRFAADPDGWTRATIAVLPRVSASERGAMLRSVERSAGPGVIPALQELKGADFAETTRRLRRTHAVRFRLRTLGGLVLQRGSWDGMRVPIERRRVRSLLGLLAANTGRALTRDAAIDTLWPESDADAAVNNLNQTVFQLRRCFDPEYRQGESAEYVLSTPELVSIDPELVRTDLQDIDELTGDLSTLAWSERQRHAAEAISLIRGEFLTDLRYETWAAEAQMRVHNWVRARLLPIASMQDGHYSLQVAVDAGTAMLALDEFDEAAMAALVGLLDRSGRRAAAREALARFSARIRSELDDEPSGVITELAARLHSSIAG